LKQLAGQSNPVPTVSTRTAEARSGEMRFIKRAAEAFSGESLSISKTLAQRLL
jgi:hypothetical protein